MSHQEELSAQGATWDKADQDLALSISAYETLDAEFEAYKLANPPLPVDPPPVDPPPPTGWTNRRLGYCPEPNTAAEIVRLGAFSGGRVRRSYTPPYTTYPSNPTFLSDPAAGLRTAHTFKVPGGGTMRDRLNRFNSQSKTEDEKTIQYILKSAKNSVWGMEHEPEDDFAQGRWDKAIYRTAQAKFCRIMDEANARDGGKRQKSLNLMSVTDQPAQIAEWYPGDGLLDIIGWDGYNWPNRNPGSTQIPRWVEFEEIYTPDYENTVALGLKFAIFEYGCMKAYLYDDANNTNPPTAEMSARQVDWHQKAFAVMRDKFKPVLATYFHHDWWLMRDEGHKAMGGNA
jgi:uncharacterized membrane protein YhdT